jgi:hypothetical protein
MIDEQRQRRKRRAQFVRRNREKWKKAARRERLLDQP